MDTGFPRHIPAFAALPEENENHDDWEYWLRWDPATDATSPNNGTFHSGSSKNDSPLQDPLLYDFGSGLDEEPLVPPLIVGDEDFGCGSGPNLASEPFFSGGAGAVDPSFDFDQIPPFSARADISKLETNLDSWPRTSSSVPDSDVLLSALSADAHEPHAAVPPSATTPSIQYSPEVTTHTRSNASSTSPEPPKKRGGRKRKAETQLEKDTAEGSKNGDPPSGDEPANKTSHNVIEKRYRNNLNDKIVELRNSVPSLRAMGRANGGEETEDLEGLTPAHKLNKATVMAKATEYIKHLEKRNKSISDEMATLKLQLAKVEAAIGRSGDGGSNVSPASTSPRSRQPSLASQSNQPHLLNVSPEQHRFGQPVMQNQYTQQQRQPTYARPPNPPVEAQNQPHMVNGRGGVLNKVMLGTMAGIMVMEGFSEHQPVGQETPERSLASIPTALLRRGLEGITSTPLSGLSTQAVMPLLKIALVIGAILYLVVPLLTFTPRRKQKMWSTAQLPKAPSLASPVEVRRMAWDTAIQTVWVPKHFLLEVVAVCSKMLQLSLRRLLGSEAFTQVTGTTKEDEAARIKAWDIAIDAQLAGGDAEVSYYRLLLTLMESGTLPDSPMRLMQKAVHFRVFFWEVANAGYGNMVGFKRFTENVGRFYWESARRLQKDLAQANSSSRASDREEVEALPDHLASLVELDCDEVLSDEMIQRAWNLAWNKPSAHRVKDNAAKDSVVEDHAIRSPLDAVAAWYTHTTLDDILVDVVSENRPPFDTEYYLRLALSVAPPASHTHVRALAAKSVLSNSNRDKNITVALEALPVLSPTRGMNLVNHTPVAPDVNTALTLAKLISLSSASASPRARERAFEMMSRMRIAPTQFTLLTAVAAFRLLRQLSAEQGLSDGAERGLEEFASSLRVWVGTPVGRESGLDDDGRSRIVKLCLDVAKHLGGWELDSGYGSATPSQTASPVPARARPEMVLT